MDEPQHCVAEYKRILSIVKPPSHFVRIGRR